ncbi:MAG: hypothetical protein ACK42B_06885, partial [Chitinophagaceae bacterium]
KATDALGKNLKYTVNKTMMRIELPTSLKPGQKFVFNIDWNYKISDRMTVGGRGGYEFFPEDGNHLFTMAQWFPRLAVYSDFQGWQHHQFTGRGEFALAFGNYNVAITVPGDHVVMATGSCQNYPAVLSAAQLARWNKALTLTKSLLKWLLWMKQKLLKKIKLLQLKHGYSKQRMYVTSHLEVAVNLFGMQWQQM